MQNGYCAFQPFPFFNRKTRKLEEVSVDEFFMGVDSLDENDSEVSEERSAKIIEKANVKKSSNRLSSNNRQQSKIKDVKRKSPSSSKSVHKS